MASPRRKAHDAADAARPGWGPSGLEIRGHLVPGSGAQPSGEGRAEPGAGGELRGALQNGCRLTRSPTVLVIEAQAKAALTVMQGLARRGCHVIGAAPHRLNSGFFSRACHERVRSPSSQSEREAFKSWLLELLQRRNIDMLFPVGHWGALAVSELGDAVREHTALLAPDHATFLRGYRKIETLKAAVAAGVPIPDSWFPDGSEESLEDCIASIERWPVLVKPSVSAGARGITWCHSAEELRGCFGSLQEAFGPCFVQDFVPQGGLQHKSDLLVDSEQELVAGVVYGKARMYPPDGGSSVLNFATRRPDILESSHRVLRELGWVGFCDFDWIDDPRDGSTRLMEINPRFPESLRMANAVGIDFASLMLDVAQGRPVEPVGDYPTDRYMRFLPGELLWFLRVDSERRFSTEPSWFRFLDRRTSYQLLSLRDPGPLLGYVLENLQMLRNGDFIRTRLRAGSSADRD